MTLKDLDKIVANLDSQGDSLEAARNRAMIVASHLGQYRKKCLKNA